MAMRFWGFGRLIMTVWLLGCGSTAAWAYQTSEAGNPIISVQLRTTVVQAEVVSSRDKLYLGLSGRRQLAPGTGMLFIMPGFEVQEFCMRGMFIPIDIIWIARDRVIGFHQNLSPQDPGTFCSPGPADLVLEVPAGLVTAAGLRTGDRLERLK